MKKYNAQKVCCLTIGVVLLVNGILAACLSNFHIGILITDILGACFCAAAFFYDRLDRILPKWLKYVFYAGICLIAASLISLFVLGKIDTVSGKEDAIIVLGAGIRGESLSEQLERRLDAAVSCYHSNPETVIVVSGGQGPQEAITEAEAMARYLGEQGIPEEKIILEERATSTYENFLYCRALLDTMFETPYAVAFVSSDYHIYRAEKIAKSVGLSEVTHSHGETAWYMWIPNGLRECMAICKLWLFGNS